MLYDGRKLDRSGYVRVEASPATCRGSTSGDHTTTAWPSTSMPRRPARPVSCVYSPAVRSTCASPLNFTSRSSTTQRAGMLMPERQRLGREDRLDQAPNEQLLDDLLERRQQSGMVGGEAPLQAVEPLPVAQDVEVLGRDVQPSGPARSPGSRRARPASSAAARRRRHCVHGGVAAGPAEDEQDRRQQALAVQALDDVRTRRQRVPAAAARPRRRKSPSSSRRPHLAGVAQQLGMDLVLAWPRSRRGTGRTAACRRACAATAAPDGAR